MAEIKLPKGITLRKDGRYMWRFRYSGVDYFGYCEKLTEAKKQLRDKRYEIEHGLSGKESAILFDVWFEEWLNTYKSADCKDSTLNLYRNTYKRYIQPEFGKKQIRKLRGDMIQRFLNRMSEMYSKSVVVKINSLLYGSLKQAARNGIISMNPMENTVLPKCRESDRKEALAEDVERAFLEEARTSQYYPLYRLASLTGMRIGEILGLQWSDVDFENGEIHITHTLSYISGRGLYLDTPKSAASRRTIPIEKNSEAYNLLKDQRKKQRLHRLQAGELWTPLEGMDDLVFTARNGKPHYARNVRADQGKIIARLSEQGIEADCTFHTFRHCFATRCLENGMNPKTLQAILGHSTFTMTMDRYSHVMEKTKRDEMRKVMNAL